MAPQRTRFLVLHDQAVAPQLARDDEGQRLVFNLADVNHARMTKRSPGGGDGRAVEYVVHDFVVIQLPRGPADGVAFGRQAHHAFFRRHLARGFLAGHEFGIQDGGNTVGR